MRLVFQLRRLSLNPALRALIKRRLLIFSDRLRIDGAVVHLERRPEASPAYRAEVRLAVAGPDMTAESVDHSPLQAVTRALRALELHARERAERRRERERERTQRSAAVRFHGWTGAASVR